MNYKLKFYISENCEPGKFNIIIERLWDWGNDDDIKTFSDTYDLAECIGITVGDFMETLIINYKGHIDDSYDVYFNSTKEAQVAVDYLESIYMMRVLTE